MRRLSEDYGKASGTLPEDYCSLQAGFRFEKRWDIFAKPCADFIAFPQRTRLRGGGLYRGLIFVALATLLPARQWRFATP